MNHPKRWADYAFDECSSCKRSTGIFADTYEFNVHFMTCPHCGAHNISGYINGSFLWRPVMTADIMAKHGSAGSKGEVR